jgi:hypothetical protein
MKDKSRVPVEEGRRFKRIVLRKRPRKSSAGSEL